MNWIPVDKELPELEGDILFVEKDKTVYRGHYLKSSQFPWGGEDRDGKKKYFASGITHYLKIEPPEDKDGMD